MDPYKFLEDFERKTSRMQEQLAQSEQAFADVRSEVTSPDGNVAITVAGGGSVESLRLTPKAMQLGHEELARTIVETLRTAQTRAAHAVQESMRPLLGDGEAMRFLTEQVEAGIARQDAAGEPEQPSRGPARGVQEMDTGYDDFDDDWNPRGGRR